jgi:hypothetical protein
MTAKPGASKEPGAGRRSKQAHETELFRPRAGAGEDAELDPGVRDAARRDLRRGNA